MAAFVATRLNSPDLYRTMNPVIAHSLCGNNVQPSQSKRQQHSLCEPAAANKIHDSKKPRGIREDK
jgi:hypothetical protein